MSADQNSLRPWTSHCSTSLAARGAGPNLKEPLGRPLPLALVVLQSAHQPARRVLSLRMRRSCFAKERLTDIQDQVKSKLLPLAGKTQSRIQNALDDLMASAKPIPDTNFVCVAPGKIDALRDYIDEVAAGVGPNPPAPARIRSNGPLVSSSTTAPSPNSPAPTPTTEQPPRELPAGFLRRVLSRFCPAYPVC